MNQITFDSVGEKYRIKFLVKGKPVWEEFFALRAINLDVPRGQILGVIGENGSGKSTLLKLAAGMLSCDEGSCCVKGRVAALMELGAGFNPDFTGRENILLNARTYGLRKEALEKCMREIEDFCDLGKFMDAPVRCYSQGMFMRLAFALAVFVDPDVFLIDDILSVG
ncbi:MAG TPA: ATP-binding cassette domain-containing protein, partial [Candidatus Omnitrophota bacterium]|nr:ATP-binding cassette domain-containing protein [Candidatus Omnitrophota bacterium]